MQDKVSRPTRERSPIDSGVDVGDGAAPASHGGGPPSDAHKPGDVLCDRYELRRVLSSGGMGTVWVAHQQVLGIDVAIKVLRPFLSGAEFAERLQREARATAQLNHPNIVRVLDVGQTARGEPFLAMEYLHGASLANLIDSRGRLPATLAVQLVLPLIDALVAAHAKGIIHRDLKPDNVVMTTSDAGVTVPKLVDFGIAMVTGDSRARRLTEAGAVLGSPDYMAPEQARGETRVDERTDVWSMCVMLYEMITGVRPFSGPNHHALLHAILTEEPTPSCDFGAGDEPLWEILARGLEKPLDARLPDMLTLGRELAAWATLAGITEDVMGTSLEVGWIRTSRHSAAFAPAPKSGAPRSSAPTRAAPAATEQEPPRQVVSEPPPVSAPAVARGRPTVLLGLAVLALVAVAGWLAQRRPDVATAPPPPPKALTSVPEVVPAPPVVTVAIAEPAKTAEVPAPSATASARKPAVPPRPASARPPQTALPVPTVPNF